MNKWLKIALYVLSSLLVLALISRIADQTTAAEIDLVNEHQQKGMIQAAAAKPNAQRDLVLKNFSWQKSEDGLAGIHSFSIYNASKGHNYTKIAVRFSYYSELGDEVAHVDKVIDKAIKAGETVRIDKLEIGTIHPQANGADMEILP